MVPSGMKIGKEELNVLEYADDIALIGGKKWNRNKKTFVEKENVAREFGTTDKPRKDKIHDSGKEKQFKEK